MPLPERNTLLAAAGFTPSFPAHELGSQAMEPGNRVLTPVLRRHEPYPACVVRQPFTFLRGNAGAEALFPGLTGLSPEQLIDLWFGPGPFCGQGEPAEEVLPAGGVEGCLVRGEAAVDQAQAGAGGGRGEDELDLGGAGG